MDAAEKVIWWAFGLLAAFVLVTIGFLIIAIDHLESWREKRAARDARKGDVSRP